MPSITTKDLIDRAVLLEAWVYDRYGRIKVNSVPREIACRWVQSTVSKGGNTADVFGIVAEVYVDEDVWLSSILWRGELKDFPKDWPNEAPAELMEVVDFHSTPSINGREQRRWCDVARFRDAEPAKVNP